jgi:peptide/nickel transport system permease protein
MDLLHGDLGTSIRTNRPVLEDLQAFFPATLELALVALTLAILVGVPLGVLSAVYHNRLIDQIARPWRSPVFPPRPSGSAWCNRVVLRPFSWLPGGGRLSEGLAATDDHGFT